jgi:hypothetical protein
MNLQNFRIEKRPAMSSVLAFLTMPFKGTGVNALKVGK